MNRKQLELAAKLWGLALIAHTEIITDDEIDKVKRLAAKRAATKLHRLGIDKADLICSEDVIEATMRLLPDK